MTKPHKQAANMILAAKNKDQLFECADFISVLRHYDILYVLKYPDYNWRPVQPKKPDVVKRWLWATDCGDVGSIMLSDEEQANSHDNYKIKLLWSETDFEVEEQPPTKNEFVKQGCELFSE